MAGATAEGVAAASVGLLSNGLLRLERRHCASASRTSLLPAARSGCCSRSLASSGYGATRLIESRIVLELQSARGIRSAYGSIGT